MLLRMLLLATLVLGGLLSPSSVQAASRTMTRREIRAMPIEKRPNRLGHFYGNTVRRRHGRS